MSTISTKLHITSKTREKTQRLYRRHLIFQKGMICLIETKLN